MKEFYEEPELKIVRLQCEDILSTSNPDLGDLENPDNGAGWA